MRPERPGRDRLRGLYAITPELEDTGELARRVALALEGGAALVQYRAKALAPAAMAEQALRLRRLCTDHGALFIVNDSIELALACGADGVHVGREDAAVARARAALPHGLIGVSCYADARRARAAAADGADYVAVGSVFASTTKPQAVHAPLAVIAEARAASGLPVAAIGGITPGNAARVAAAGADMAAVISALFDAVDIRAAARAVASAFDPTPEPSHVRAQPRAL